MSKEHPGVQYNVAESPVTNKGFDSVRGASVNEAGPARQSEAALKYEMTRKAEEAAHMERATRASALEAAIRISVPGNGHTEVLTAARAFQEFLAGALPLSPVEEAERKVW